MSQQLVMRSPSRQQQPRKVYDYLLSELTPAQKYTNLPLAPQHSPHSKEPNQYELIVEFELRREKQKTLILQERLKNKESFIKQMKQFQDELTLAFEKCQEQLHYYKAQCQQYQNRQVSFPTFNNGITLNDGITHNSVPNGSNIISDGPNMINDLLIQPSQEQIIRQYIEEIAELKHLVIRLQEEINYYEKRNKKITKNQYFSSSAQNSHFNPKQPQSLIRKTQPQLSQVSPISKKNRKQNIQPKDQIQRPRNKNQRSKTLANQFIEQKNSKNFNTYKQISEFIHEQSRKVSSFINHFLTMCQFFQHSIQNQVSIKQKLKRAWKWIKAKIVEWKYLKQEKIQNVKEYKIGNLLSKMLAIENLSMPQIQTLLEKIIKPSSETLTKRQ